MSARDWPACATYPGPTCVASEPHYFPEQCRGESAWVTPPADTASTGADVEVLDELAALELAEEIWEDEPTDAEQLLMQRVLASDWLAAHDAATAERVRRETEEGLRLARLVERDMAEQALLAWRSHGVQRDRLAGPGAGPMSALVDWDSPHWGQPGHNVHESAWLADGRHDDETGDDQ